MGVRERKKKWITIYPCYLSIIFKSSVPLNMANKMSLYLANSEECLLLKMQRKVNGRVCVTPESLKSVLKIVIYKCLWVVRINLWIKRKIGDKTRGTPKELRLYLIIT